MTASILSAVIDLFRFYTSSSFSLEDYIFLEICPFHLGLTFLGIQFLVVISYNPLYFGGISCSLSSFISNFVYWVLSLFFLMSLLKGLSILFIFSKNQLLDSLILRILLISMSFNFALILVISFLVLALGCLCCCSLSSCRRSVRLFV